MGRPSSSARPRSRRSSVASASRSVCKACGRSSTSRPASTWPSTDDRRAPGLDVERRSCRALRGERQALCVVNSRRHASDLFAGARTIPTHCTSVPQCARPTAAKVVAEIRRRLSREVNAPCRVISTQVIEAGVDVDFPAVFRAAAGLDSMAQASGRCNREGRLVAEDGQS